MLFSVPIFVIVLRETLEAAIIVSVLLSLVQNLVFKEKSSAISSEDGEINEDIKSPGIQSVKLSELESSGGITAREKKLVRKMKIQIFVGAFIGLFIAICIGAAFIAVFFTTLNDLWGQAEELWEGIFSLIACIMIFVMGITMLRMDRAKLKWKRKLEKAFDDISTNPDKINADSSIWEDMKFWKTNKAAGNDAKWEKWALVILPCITVLREGLEAVVFVGGVSLGQSAKSIPIAAIVGLICGVTIGYIIYASSSRLSLSIFLVVSTNFLLLIGAGLFSKAVGDFQSYEFNQLTGGDAAESGDGPGSFNVHGYVWDFDCCNPEMSTSGEGWSIFNAILGWNNVATIGTILSYVFYWVAAIVVLVYMKWSEGRTRFFGIESERGRKRRIRREIQNDYSPQSKSEKVKEVEEEGHVQELTV